MKFKETLEGIFDEGTEEYNIIKETYDLITQSAPTIAAEAKTHLILLDHNKVKLSTLYYGICRKISNLRDQVQTTHDASYVRLVKVGRPSKDAIEAEIRMTNPKYSGISKKISDYEDVKDLISMYIRCVDSSRTTTLEILKNIYRLD